MKHVGRIDYKKLTKFQIAVERLISPVNKQRSFDNKVLFSHPLCEVDNNGDVYFKEEILNELGTIGFRDIKEIIGSFQPA